MCFVRRGADVCLLCAQNEEEVQFVTIVCQVSAEKRLVAGGARDSAETSAVHIQ